MGSANGETGRSVDEAPQVAIVLFEPFAVGKFEVTFAEWDVCVAEGGCAHRPGDKGWGRDRRPVINVSWNHVTQQYLPWLSRKTDQSYRLLSEAEWEYAARGGSTAAYWWGDEPGSARANCKGCDSGSGGGRTSPVGSFCPNPFGIHDLSGNVFELTVDCWNIEAWLSAPIPSRRAGVTFFPISLAASGRRSARRGIEFRPLATRDRGQNAPQARTMIRPVAGDHHRQPGCDRTAGWSTCGVLWRSRSALA